MRRDMRRRIGVVVLSLIMSVTMMFAAVGCGSNEAVNDDATLAAEATTVEETTAVTEETSETTTETSETTTEETTKETTKATTKATTTEAKTCSVTVEGFCNNKKITIKDGDTAYSVLKASGASVSAKNSEYGIYVEGINGRFEKDEGPTSGWMYSVNGSTPNKSAGDYKLKKGDKVKWYYVSDY